LRIATVDQVVNTLDRKEPVSVRRRPDADLALHPLLVALTPLDRLSLAALRRGLGHEVVEQTPSGYGDLVDGPRERLGVRAGGMSRPADLSHKLHGGFAD